MAHDDISADVPDWSRERPEAWWDPPKRFLAAHRAIERHGRGRPVRRKLAVLRHRFWALVTQMDIAAGTRIGGGLRLPHPNGIVVHPDSVIGPNCQLMQQVTLGIGGSIPGAPRLGGHVDVGAGAKIIGGVTIGDHAQVGANAVVIRDVEPYAIVAGVPARVIGSSRSDG